MTSKLITDVFQPKKRIAHGAKDAIKQEKQSATGNVNLDSSLWFVT